MDKQEFPHWSIIANLIMIGMILGVSWFGIAQIKELKMNGPNMESLAWTQGFQDQRLKELEQEISATIDVQQAIRELKKEVDYIREDYQFLLRKINNPAKIPEHKKWNKLSKKEKYGKS